jgi:hypothetical protein
MKWVCEKQPFLNRTKAGLTLRQEQAREMRLYTGQFRQRSLQEKRCHNIFSTLQARKKRGPSHGHHGARFSP